MPFYESVFIARQDISAAQVEALADEFSKIIDNNGGRVAKRENWGIRSLAYKIKKNRKGHYVLLNLDAPIEAVHEMERQMRINEDILRHLTLRLDELDDEPSIIMQRGSSRDDRPRRDDFNRNDAPESQPVSDVPAEAKPLDAASEGDEA